jgi:hypothetical protein
MEKNLPLKPEMFSLGSSRTRVWWKCANDHTWLETVQHRSRRSGCPYCARVRASKTYNLEVINPDLAKQWHLEKNGDLTPSQVTPSSGKKVWWICPRGHVWEATVVDRSKGTGCPTCERQYEKAFRHSQKLLTAAGNKTQNNLDNWNNPKV